MTRIEDLCDTHVVHRMDVAPGRLCEDVSWHRAMLWSMSEPHRRGWNAGCAEHSRTRSWTTEKSAVLRKPREGTQFAFTCSLEARTRVSQRNREDSREQHPGQLIFSPPLSQDAAQPQDVCVASSKCSSSAQVMQRKQLSIVTGSHCSEGNPRSPSTRRRLSPIDLDSWWPSTLSGRANNAYMQQTWRPVGTGNRCRAKPSNTGKSRVNE